MSKVVILADGEFPQCRKVLDILRTADTVICCDGAADKLLQFGREPDWIVGDLDSVSAEAKTRFADRAVKFYEQETNDLAKAFRFCSEKGFSPTAVLGASGAREDHLLGNLSRFAEYAIKYPDCRLYTDRGCFSVFSGKGEFSGRAGGQISIFSFDPQQKISSTGLKYPLNELNLPWWHSGTLNEIVNGKFTLQATSAVPVLVFFND